MILLTSDTTVLGRSSAAENTIPVKTVYDDIENLNLESDWLFPEDYQLTNTNQDEAVQKISYPPLNSNNSPTKIVFPLDNKAIKD